MKTKIKMMLVILVISLVLVTSIYAASTTTSKTAKTAAKPAAPQTTAAEKVQSGVQSVADMTQQYGETAVGVLKNIQIKVSGNPKEILGNDIIAQRKRLDAFKAKLEITTPSGGTGGKTGTSAPTSTCNAQSITSEISSIYTDSKMSSANKKNKMLAAISKYRTKCSNDKYYEKEQDPKLKVTIKTILDSFETRANKLK